MFTICQEEKPQVYQDKNFNQISIELCNLKQKYDHMNDSCIHSSNKPLLQTTNDDVSTIYGTT